MMEDGLRWLLTKSKLEPNSMKGFKRGRMSKPTLSTLQDVFLQKPEESLSLIEHLLWGGCHSVDRDTCSTEQTLGTLLAWSVRLNRQMTAGKNHRHPVSYMPQSSRKQTDSCVNAGKLVSSLPSLTHSGHCFPTDVTVTPFFLPAGPNMGITPNKLNCYTWDVSASAWSYWAMIGWSHWPQHIINHCCLQVPWFFLPLLVSQGPILWWISP